MGKVINHNIILGSIGTASTFLLGHLDYALGVAAGFFTVGILIIRIRKEWRHRDE